MDSLGNGNAIDFSLVWKNYLCFEQLYRSDDQKLGDFLMQWKKEMKAAQSAGCQYSDVLLACKLLDKSNIGHRKAQSIVDFVGEAGSNFLIRILNRLEELVLDISPLPDIQEECINFNKLENHHLFEIKEELTDEVVSSSNILPTENILNNTKSEKEFEIFRCIQCNADLGSTSVTNLGEEIAKKILCQTCDNELYLKKNPKLRKPPKQKLTRDKRIVSKLKNMHHSDNSSMSKNGNEILHNYNDLESRETSNADEERRESHACDICGKVFDRHHKLTIHLRRHHTPTVPQERQNKEVQLQCDKCGSKFRLLKRLQKHEPHCGKQLIKKYVRKYKGNQSTTCEICGKSFKRHYGLLVHMAHHTKEKSFKCEFCPNAFGYESALRAHRKKHVEHQSLECPKCDKIFICGVDLRVHLRQTHPKEHRFRCGQCNYSTNMNARYKRHVLTHTSDQPFKCKICFKVYKGKDSVKRHLWVFHKIERHEKDKIFECIGINADHDT